MSPASGGGRSFCGQTDVTSSGQQNNYTLAATDTVLRVGNLTDVQFSGFVVGSPGPFARVLVVFAAGTGSVTLQNESLASDAGNRIITGSGVDFTIPSPGAAILTYDVTSSRWRVLGPVASSGTYTPTLTAVTNVAGLTAYSCQFMRVGNVVTVSGRIGVDPTSTGQTVFGVSLPIGSNIGAITDIGGVAVESSGSTAFAPQTFGIRGDLTNDRADVRGNVSVTDPFDLAFTFTYILK